MKWINVKEKLPERLKGIIIYLKKHKAVVPAVAFLDYNNKICFMTASESVWNIGDDVEFWMPFPKPPQGE